jgi:hypothetical protein
MRNFLRLCLSGSFPTFHLLLDGHELFLWRQPKLSSLHQVEDDFGEPLLVLMDQKLWPKLKVVINLLQCLLVVVN